MDTKKVVKSQAAKARKKTIPVKQYDFVECRTLGHSWKSTNATKGPLFGYYLWLECSQCGMIRMDTINALGRVGARSYRQPDGYRNPEISDRATYRLEMMNRVLRDMSAKRKASKQAKGDEIMGGGE